MRKSREFDSILDECLERLLVKDETIEQCLQDFSGYADELKPLLETALAVNKASAIQPRPEFRDRARYQFHLALQEMEREKGRPFFSWRWQPQWAMAVAIVLVFVLAGGGTVVAAGGSMPDEPLYPVKLATEQVQLFFTPSALGKAELYARLADKRVLEIVRMAGENKPDQIERTAQRLDDYLHKIAALASTQEVTEGLAMVPAVREMPAVERVPALELAPAVEEALVAEAELAVGEAPLLPERAGGGQEVLLRDGHRARLKAIIVRHAVAHPARLRALLATVPHSARPALLRAIAISETGYERALQYLD